MIKAQVMTTHKKRHSRFNSKKRIINSKKEKKQLIKIEMMDKNPLALAQAK